MFLTLGLMLLGAPAAKVLEHRDVLVIPAFARRYRVSCSRCHVAAPKLNAVGEAFRLNGYRFPRFEPATREDQPVPLGEEPWKDLFPKAIWPGELPATLPIAIRVQSDLEMSRDRNGETTTNFRLPQDVYLLAGGSLGERVGVFVEGEWNRDEGAELLQAKVGFLDLLPRLGSRAVNLWVGLQNLYLFTFADRQIDRVARQPFVWQRFGPADLPISAAGGTVTPVSDYRIGANQPSVEVSGLGGSRFWYAVGLGQGGATGRRDNNDHKDIYYKARYKIGGLGLDGSYPAAVAKPGAFGQFHDHTVVVETFGYFGREPSIAGVESRHRTVGAVLRAVWGPTDVGAGVVRLTDDQPYGPSLGSLRMTSVFAKAEHAFYPWLIGSFKAEWLAARVPESSGFSGRVRERHVQPGLVGLIRQNIRLVAEADLYSTYSVPLPGRSPNGLWIRLDLAF